MSERRREALVWVVGLLVVFVLCVAVALRPSEPVPCVDYIPANVGCTADSPAVLNRR